MRRLSAPTTQPKERQKRDRQPGFTFEFYRPFRPIFSFRLNPIKRFRYVPGSSKSNRQESAVSIAKRKRSKYAHVRPPPPLTNDLGLMQFMGGGSIETYTKRLMEEQARAAGGSRGMVVGTADVYRDSNSGIWWDAEEEVEYAHLLDGMGQAENDGAEVLWEDFDTSSVEGLLPSTSRSQYHDRHSSTESASSADSDLDLIPPPELATYPTFTSSEVNDCTVLSSSSSRVGGGNMHSLSSESPLFRSSRQARHLLRPIPLIDSQAFGKPQPEYPSSPSALISSDYTPSMGGDLPARPDHKPKRAQRRRVLPSPLDFDTAAESSSNLQNVPGSAPTNAVHFEIDTIRRQFIKDSFAPSPSATTTLPTRTPHSVSSSINSKSPRNGRSKKVPKYSSSIFSIRTLFRKRSN